MTSQLEIYTYAFMSDISTDGDMTYLVMETYVMYYNNNILINLQDSLMKLINSHKKDIINWIHTINNFEENTTAKQVSELFNTIPEDNNSLFRTTFENTKEIILSIIIHYIEQHDDSIFRAKYIKI